MRSTGLPARIVYALVALPVGGAVGFYGTVWIWPPVEKILNDRLEATYDYDVFKAGVAIGVGLAFTAALLALTLPWKRRRRRSGRVARIVVCGVVVLTASLAFAGQGYSVVYDLVFAAWLAYAMALTIVRYGVLDPVRGTVGGPAMDEVDEES